MPRALLTTDKGPDCLLFSTKPVFKAFWLHCSTLFARRDDLDTVLVLFYELHHIRPNILEVLILIQLSEHVCVEEIYTSHGQRPLKTRSITKLIKIKVLLHQFLNLMWPISGTAQIRVVTCHQYGISAGVAWSHFPGKWCFWLWRP